MESVYNFEFVHLFYISLGSFYNEQDTNLSERKIIINTVNYTFHQHFSQFKEQ